MKKLTRRYRKWLLHRQAYQFERGSQRERRFDTADMVQTSGHTWRAITGRRKLQMPEVMCFDQNCVETLEALADIRRTSHVRMRGRRAGQKGSKHRKARSRWANPYRAFEQMRDITPAAALVMAAEYERASRLAGAPIAVVNVSRWEPVVLNTLWDIGFFEIVGFPKHIEKPDLRSEYALLPMRSGDTADSIAITQLIDDLKALHPDDTGALVHLYGAMIEAVMNACVHAYPAHGSFKFQHVGRWWMTGAINRKERRTTAVIFDQGITIPLSLPNWQYYAGWRHKISSMLGLAPLPSDTRSDGSAIAAAVEVSVSSTGELHRGHGLAQMRNFVDQCKEGHLRIMSRCGEVIFRPGGKLDIRTHAVSVGGTLIVAYPVVPGSPISSDFAISAG